MKRALVVRHTDYEGIAGFADPVEAAGYAIERIDIACPGFATADFLAPDLLILMGGPMGVYERAAHPWIAGELARLGARLAADRPTLGVCLGAQMIAAALGARVYPGPVKEVGFGALALTDAGRAGPLRHLADVPVLHWHGDSFDLPEGTTLLASTPRYANQAFARGARLLGLQCHPEMGEDLRFERWLGDAAYVAQGGTTVDQLRADYAAKGPAAVAAGRATIAQWLAGLG